MIRHSDEIDGLRIPRRWVGDVEQLIEVEGGVEGAVCRHGGDGPGECSTVPSRISICVSAFDLQIEMKLSIFPSVQQLRQIATLKRKLR